MILAQYMIVFLQINTPVLTGLIRKIMKNLLKMKALLGMFVVFFMGFSSLNAQDVTTVEAMNDDISNNLDLEAVANIFADSKNLEDFEKRLNDPEAHISNLDLNKDGYVDYLRIVEQAEDNTHLISIQAVLGDDLYQDVATIEVEKDHSTGKTHVQVVGDVYMYGPDYIIEPVYVYRPVIFSWFWRPRYRLYCSAYYWGYYPPYYHYWHPFRTHIYVEHIHTYCAHYHHTYHYVHRRRSAIAARLHKKYRRADYARRHPNRSYSRRKNVHNRGLALASRSRRRGVSNNRVSNNRRSIKTRGEKLHAISKRKTMRRAVNSRRNFSKRKPVRIENARTKSNKHIRLPERKRRPESTVKNIRRETAKPVRKRTSRSLKSERKHSRSSSSHMRRNTRSGSSVHSRSRSGSSGRHSVSGRRSHSSGRRR